jgi:hypothetical protein
MTQASLFKRILQTYLSLTEAADIYQRNQNICRFKSFNLGDILPGFINIMLCFYKMTLMNLPISSLHQVSCVRVLDFSPSFSSLHNNATILLCMVNKQVLVPEEINPCKSANTHDRG